MAAALAAMVTALSGCGSFFVYPGSSSTTTNTGDYVYVSNSTTGTTYINGYSLSSGTMAALSGSPINLNFVPSAMAITPNNDLLFVASVLGNGIYSYSISTSGTLTAENSSVAVAGGNPVSIDISPDGQWLFALDSLSYTLSEYSINNSTGTLSLVSQTTYTAASGTTITPYQVRVAPTGNYVVAVIGDAGDIVFPFTTSSGALGSSYVISTANAGAGGADYAVAIDSSNNAYIARSGGTTSTIGVAAYQLGSTSATAVSGSPFVTTAVPKSLVLSTSYGYLYTGNELDTSLSSTSGTSSAFSQSSGKLTSLGAVVAAPFDVYSMGRDNSGKYILAAGYNSSGNGVIMYAIGTTGTLTSTSNEPTAASVSNSQGLPTYPAVMALTH